MSRKHLTYRLCLLLCSIFGFYGGVIFLAPHSQAASRNDFGGIGLVQMPTARFAEDGTVGMGISYVDPELRTYASWQATPWLQAVLSIVGDPDRAGDGDTSLDIKIRLLQENAFIPELAVGFQDLLGKGRYSGEYIVASKRYYSFDFTAGLGWGYFNGRRAFKNPARGFYSSFDTRNEGVNSAGRPQWKNYFSGKDVGFFAGVEYQTPVQGLSIKAEYSGEQIPDDAAFDHLRGESHLNGAVVYSPFDGVEISTGYERGDRVMLRLSVQGNIHKLQGVDHKVFTDDLAESHAEQAYVPLRTVAAYQQASVARPAPFRNEAVRGQQNWQTTLLKALLTAGFEGAEIGVEGTQAILKLVFDAGTLPRQAVQAAALAYQYIPPQYDTLLIEDRFGYGIGQIFSRAQVAAYVKLDEKFDRYWTEGAMVQSLQREGGQETGEVQQSGRDVVVLEAPEQELPFEQLRPLLGPRQLLAMSLRAGQLILVLDRPAETPEAEQLMLGGLLQYIRDVKIITQGPDGLTEMVVNRDDPAGQQAVEAFNAWKMKIEQDKVSTIEPAAGREPVKAAKPEDYGLPVISQHQIGQKQEVVLADTQSVNLGWTIMRAGAVLAKTVPPEITYFDVSVQQQSVEVVHALIVRQHIEDAAEGKISPEELRIAIGTTRGHSGLYHPSLNNDLPFVQRFNWSVQPDVLLHAGQSSDGGFRGQVYAKAMGEYQFLRQFKVRGELLQNIAGNLDGLPEETVAGNPPKTRRDLGRYIDEGSTAIGRLLVDYKMSPSEEWVVRLQGGLLERMYGGVQAEVLYDPYGGNYALGGEVAWAKKRDYDQLFDFQNHESWTALIKYYQEDDLRGLRLEMAAGRFLAKDWGIKADLARRFANGMRIGVWATVTTMNTSRYGAGRYDKGLYISMPLEMLWFGPSTEMVTTRLQGLGHDGGQTIDSYDNLYDIRYRGREETLRHDWPHKLQ